LPPSSATRSNSARLAFTSAQQVLGVDHQQLVAPDDAALAVDRADPVAVAVEGHSEIEALLRDETPQVGQILLLGRIGMMVGKVPVDLGVEREVLPWEPGDERLERGSRRAVARVPADPKSGQAILADAGDPFNQPVDVSGHDLAALDRPGARSPSAEPSYPPELEDVLAEERPSLKYHLEAIVIGGIVAAGYLNAAIHVFG
jgi:hypothetical protein